MATRQIAPSSPFVVEAMTAPIPMHTGGVVIEYGAGTGVMTEALLHRLPRHARLIAFERNSRLASQLQGRLSDERLHVISDSAETVGRVLQSMNCARVDGVVSSLGLAMLPEQTVNRVFEATLPFLHSGSVMTQCQYVCGMGVRNGRIAIHNCRDVLDRYFRRVTRKTVLLNPPPMSVFICDQPFHATAGS